MNLCHSATNSCSACCGLYNTTLSDQCRSEWLEENTANFLKLDLIDRESVIAFRQIGESWLNRHKINQEIYNCPFLGYTSKLTTGCLLHPEGSPHPMIKNSRLDKTRNYSFYGEQICSGYDCLAKNKIIDEPGRYPELSPGGLAYGRWVSNHNLIEALALVTGATAKDPKKTGRIIEKYIEENNLPVTSFEIALDLTKYQREELWGVLGTLLTPSGYNFNPFHITPDGKKLGYKLEQQVNEP